MPFVWLARGFNLNLQLLCKFWKLVLWVYSSCLIKKKKGTQQYLGALSALGQSFYCNLYLHLLFIIQLFSSTGHKVYREMKLISYLHKRSLAS